MHEPAPSPSPRWPTSLCVIRNDTVCTTQMKQQRECKGFCSFFFLFFLILRGCGQATLCSKEWFNSLQMGFSESFFAEFMERVHRCGTDGWLIEELYHTLLAPLSCSTLSCCCCCCFFPPWYLKMQRKVLNTDCCRTWKKKKRKCYEILCTRSPPPSTGLLCSLTNNPFS